MAANGVICALTAQFDFVSIRIVDMNGSRRPVAVFLQGNHTQRHHCRELNLALRLILSVTGLHRSDQPPLCVIVLCRPGDQSEVLLLNFMCIHKSAAALLLDSEGIVTRGYDYPSLRVIVVRIASNKCEVLEDYFAFNKRLCIHTISYPTFVKRLTRYTINDHALLRRRCKPNELTTVKIFWSNSRLLIQFDYGQHTAGFSFFGAVGVVATWITGSARAGVVNVLYTQRAALLADFGGKIDFVVGWANTGAELHDHVRGIGAEVFNHLSDRVWDDAKLCAFASGVHKPDRRCVWIYNVNSAAISDVNTKRDLALVSDEAIAAGEFGLARFQYRGLSGTFCVAAHVLGRLALCKGEGEGEG